MVAKSALITVMERAARKAAPGLRRDFGEVENLQVSLKGPADFVSTADMRVEAILREELAKARANYGMMLEEGGIVEGAPGAPVWVVDPIDGTTNFIHGIPHFAISIAAVQAGEILAGLIYNPITDESFWAERGCGAWVNGKRLRVSARRDMTEAVIATGIPHYGRGDAAAYLPMLSAVMASCAGVRRMGAASLDLAYVAAGRYEGYFEEGLFPWDVAAGILLVREAGGSVSDYAGGAPNLAGKTSIVAGNGQLHDKLTRLLTKAREQ